MRGIITVAGMTLRVLFRNKTGWLLLAATAMISVFIFSVSRSDGILENELRLRIRYGLQFGITAFSLALLWVACVNMRGDIDAKRIHLLTSYPLRRTHIFLGKWLGLVGLGVAGLAVALLSIGLASTVMLARWSQAEEVSDFRASFARVHRQVRPELPDTGALIRQRFEQLEQQGMLPDTEDERVAIREKMRHELNQQLQLIRADEKKIWNFKLGDIPRNQETFNLEWRFYSRKDAAVKGAFRVGNPGEADVYYEEVSFDTNTSRKLTVPIGVVPPSGEVYVQFESEAAPEMVAYSGSGMKLSYDAGSMLGNLLRFCVLMMGHFAVVAAIGLAVSVPFTMSIASFVATALYGLALASNFFQRFLVEEWFGNEPGIVDSLVRVFIRFGLFFATGLEMPNAIYSFSESVQISSSNVQMFITRDTGNMILAPLRLLTGSADLGSKGLALSLGYAIYLTLIVLIGATLLRRKELDRVH